MRQGDCIGRGVFPTEFEWLCIVGGEGCEAKGFIFVERGVVVILFFPSDHFCSANTEFFEDRVDAFWNSP